MREAKSVDCAKLSARLHNLYAVVYCVYLNRLSRVSGHAIDHSSNHLAVWDVLLCTDRCGVVKLY